MIKMNEPPLRPRAPAGPGGCGPGGCGPGGDGGAEQVESARQDAISGYLPPVTTKGHPRVRPSVGVK